MRFPFFGLAGLIASYFNVNRDKGLGSFFQAHQEYAVNPHIVFNICQKLVAEGILQTTGSLMATPPFNLKYTAMTIDGIGCAYGEYDFLAFGFPAIRAHFIDSVRAIIVEKTDGSSDIGTGFLLEDNRLVTARHCIEGMRQVEIPGWNSADAPLRTITIPGDDNVDLAVLAFGGNPFPGARGFRLADATVLDDVLTMGYPPISGFEPLLISELAQVSAITNLKSSSGFVVGQGTSYLDRQDYFLFSARVKGGNSGGPVINRRGCVVGVVAAMPMNDSTIENIGYGLAIPSSCLSRHIPDRLKIHFPAIADKMITKHDPAPTIELAFEVSNNAIFLLK